MTDCTFCRIANGEIPATIVGRSADAVAFRDLNPQAPTHVLVIPKQHISGINEADVPGATGPVAAVLQLAVQVAKELRLEQGGYRVVFNHGKDAGQSVFHLHAHVLGGRKLDWPPG